MRTKPFLSFLTSCAAFACSLAASNAHAQLQAGAPWPKAHANTGNTGLGPSSQANGAIAFTCSTDSSFAGAPVVAHNGPVFTASSNGKVFSLNAQNGTENWGDTFNVQYSAGPAIGQNGFLYAGDKSGNLVALSAATGALLWTYAVPSSMGIESAPTIGPDGTVYFGCDDGKLYAIDGTTGAFKWSFATSGAVLSCPAIGSDGSIYIGSEDGNVYAVDSFGNEKWSFTSNGEVEGSVALASSGDVFFGTAGNSVYCLSSAGTQVWKADTIGQIVSTPAIGPDGTVFVSSMDTTVYALNGQNGSQLWNFEGIGPIQGSPIASADGNVYVGDTDGDYFGIDGSNGSQLWHISPDSVPIGDGAMGSDGTIYYNGGSLYAVDSNDISDFYVSPSSISGGVTARGVVQMTHPAKLGGETVAIHTTDTNLSPPVEVTVPAGKTGVSFAIPSMTVSSADVATVSAIFHGTTKNSKVTLTPTVLTSFYTLPITIVGGHTTKGVVQVSLPVQSLGLAVNLLSGSPDVSVPTTVTILNGHTGQSFNITSSVVSTTESVTLTATMGSSMLQATVDLEPYFITDCYVSPSTVTGGVATHGVVQLIGPAGPGGNLIALQSSDPNAVVPANVTVPAGKTGVSFPITTSLVSAAKNVTISAVFETSGAQASLIVNPSALTNFYVAPTSVTGGTPTYGVVQLTGKAGPGGDIVSLTGGTASVIIPATVTVPAGSTGVSFQIKTKTVTTATTVTINATFNSVTKQATVMVKP